MKKVIATYEDIVVPGEQLEPKADTPDNNQNKPQSSNDTKKTSEGSGKSSKKNSKKSGKDEQGGEALKTRAEKLSEDPYATESEMSSMEGGSKEKEKKVDDDQEGSGGGSKEESGDKQKDEAKEAKKEMDIIVSRADKILFQAKGMFPFDFFPNTLTIDANKVNVIIKTFFATETATSVMLKEIMDVRVESTLFFGKLIIDYGPHPLKINTVYVPTLRKKDALKAKEIVEGMIVLYRGENIDTSKLKPEDTMDEIKEIGKIEERE